jgi:hypothetical protein
MKHLREYIQTILVVCLGVCHLVLILRFSLDLAGTSLVEGALSPVYSLSEFLINPFKDTFDLANAADSTLNYSILCAIVVYSFILFCLFKLTHIFFKLEGRNRIVALINLFFSGVFFVHLARAILDYSDSNDSSFSSITRSLTSILTSVLISLLPDDFANEIIIRSIITLLFIALIWYTVYKAASAILDKMPDKHEKVVLREPETKKEERKLQESETEKEQVEEYVKTTKEERQTSKSDSKLLQTVKKFPGKVISSIKEFFKNLSPKEEAAFKQKDKSKKTTKSPLQQ